MHVFHIKGVSGLLLFLLAVVGVLALVIGVPSAFMMVLWNAFVFEGLHGPSVNILQGLLLWLATAIALKLVFKPQIQLQFKSVANPTPAQSTLRPLVEQLPLVELEQFAEKADVPPLDNNIQSE